MSYEAIVKVTLIRLKHYCDILKELLIMFERSKDRKELAFFLRAMDEVFEKIKHGLSVLYEYVEREVKRNE